VSFSLPGHLAYETRHMFDLFSDIFACRDNLLTRIDPRPKLLMALVTILLVVFSTRLLLPLLVLLACQGVALALRIPPRLLLMRLCAPMGIVAVLVVLQAFTVEGTPLCATSFCGWHLVASWEGLNRGLLLGARVLASVSVIVLLSSVTPAHKVFHALRCFGLPEAWVEIALLMYRYTFALVDQACDVAAAQRVRLGYSTARRSLASAGVLAGTVLTRSIDQAMRTHEAMTLRGYEGRILFCSLAPMSRTDRILMGAGPITAVLAFFLCEWWPL
jgi:cobalt/nickel transport system permease protein